MSIFKSHAFKAVCMATADFVMPYKHFVQKPVKNLAFKKLFCLLILCLSISTINSFGQSTIVFSGDFDNGIIVNKNKPNVWQRYAPSQPTADEHRWRLDSDFVR